MDECNEWWNRNEDGVFFRTERSVVVDYNIGTRRWTGIAEKGRRARSKENYGAGPTGLGLAIPVGFERAFLCGDDFFWEVLRLLTAFLARVERGDRAAHLVRSVSRTVEHVTADALGGGRDGEWVPRDDVREARDGGTAQRIGRRKGLRGKHGVEGDGHGEGEVGGRGGASGAGNNVTATGACRGEAGRRRVRDCLVDERDGETSHGLHLRGG